MADALGIEPELFAEYKALDANLFGLLHRLSQVVGRVHPVPRLRATAEGIVQTNRHLGRDAGPAPDGGLEFQENQRTKRNQRSKLNADNPAKPAIEAGVHFAKTGVNACFEGRQALALLLNDPLDAGKPGVEIAGGRCGLHGDPPGLGCDAIPYVVYWDEYNVSSREIKIACALSGGQWYLDTKQEYTG